MLLFAGIIVTVLVFVIVAYRWHKLHNRNQETPQGSCHVSCVFLAFQPHVVLLCTVVYEEPYDWTVSRLPQAELVMEQCPAYGVLTK